MNLNIITYTEAIKLGSSEPSSQKIVKLLFKFITDREDILNKNNEQYDLENRQINKWLNGVENIPSGLKSALKIPTINQLAEQHFEDYILPMLPLEIENRTYERILRLVKEDSSISGSIRDEIMNYYDDGDFSPFLSSAFLQAIQNKVSNKVSQSYKAISLSSVTSDIEKINEKLKNIPAPTQIDPPDDDSHLLYVTELLNAYAQDSNTDIINKDKILQKERYLRHFTRHRKNYYRAESINQSARDIFLEKGTNEFDILKDETYEGIIDVCEKRHKTILDRIDNVMEHVTIINPNKSLLLKIPNWVGPSEKKGICHILVNEERLNWRDDDDETI